MVAIRKGDGTKIRLCLDFRQLNLKTYSQNSAAIPNIAEIFDSLANKKYFTNLDLKEAFHSIPIAKDHRYKTAFMSPTGKSYQFIQCPFGLSYVPNTFSILIPAILGDTINKFVVAFVDDVLIFSDIELDHLAHIEEILQRLEEAKLHLSIEKCNFAQSTVTFLGHTVSEEGIQPSVKNIEEIKNLQPPRTVRQVRAVYGLFGYYRRFIPNFAVKAQPLTNLIKPDKKFVWTKECQTAFDHLKDYLISRPLLRFPDFTKQFILTTDASDLGAGAVLAQRAEDDLIHPVAFFSKAFTAPEKKYAATERELASVIAAVKHWHVYLFAQKFQLVTDHQCLSFLKQAKTPNQRLARWSLILSAYDFDVVYKPGTQIAHADALSRLFYDEVPEEHQVPQSQDNSILSYILYMLLT